MWKICVSEPFENCERIFPTKQKYVKEIIDALQEDAAVQRVVIFGSAVTSACNPWSDIDMYIEQSENKKVSLPPVKTDLDVWTNYTADETLLREIVKKGVTVYERREVK